jgi:hypothetical protein
LRKELDDEGAAGEAGFTVDTDDESEGEGLSPS